MMRRYLVATLALAAVASMAAGSVFAGDDTDQTLRRMGEGATRLTARIVEKPLNLKSLLASSPGEPTPFEHSSGYFKLNRTKSAEMFYFYFKSRSTTPSKDPVVLWMTGGPGCSSELAVFYENGPVSFFLCSFIRAIRLTSCFVDRLEHVVDDVFIMVRRFEENGPPEGRKFKIKARDADLYDSQDWDTASDDGSMSIRSSEADATARL